MGRARHWVVTALLVGAGALAHSQTNTAARPERANLAPTHAESPVSPDPVSWDLVAAERGPPTSVVPVLPPTTGPFWPALTQLAGSRPTGEELADVDSCEGCHASIASQWQTSAHAFSSFNNPLYRVSVEGVRARAGRTASRMCGGCHDPALLVDDAMDEPVRATDPRAHAGVTCRTCHGVQRAGVSGNGSYWLRPEALARPQRDDAQSVRAHRQAASARTVGNRLCISCHRSFVSSQSGNAHHLTGMDDAASWQASAFAGQGARRVDVQLPATDCIGCHMAREPAALGDAAAGDDGHVASHRFLGGHSYLAAMRGDPEMVERVQRFLHGVASLDVAAITLDGGPPWLLADSNASAPSPEALQRAQSLGVDIVLRNLSAGHHFPGGTKDAQDTWIAVTVLDDMGRTLARAGHGDTAASDTQTADERHVLRATAVDMQGNALWTRAVDRIAGIVTDTTLGPRDVAAVRYRFTLAQPTEARGVRTRTLRIRARLLHRSRNPQLQQLACEDSQGPLAARRTEAARAAGLDVLDPCAQQPITEIARTEVRLAPDTAHRPRSTPPAPPRWRRLYEHGLALMRVPNEEVGHAGPSLMAALALRRTDEGYAFGAIAAALAEVASRQGRVALAQQWLAQARLDTGRHPALDRIEAEALGRVWRFDEALAPARSLVDQTPDNPASLSLLAQTLGALGRHREAAQVAARGLTLQPHQADLLRVQAATLSALGAPGAARARAAYAPVAHGLSVQRRLRFDYAAQSAQHDRQTRTLHVHGVPAPAGRPQPAHP